MSRIQSKTIKRLLFCLQLVESKMEVTANDTNTSESPNSVVLTALRHLLANKFPHLEVNNYGILKASENGDNYIGVVYRVTVNFKQQVEPFKLILKVPPHNEIRRKQFFARPCFLRESLAYNEYLPLIRQFQASKGIGEHSPIGFHETGECYCCIMEEMNEAIFMEDLCVKQFELFDRFDQLDADHVAPVMRAYGKLHAVGFAIKDQQPEKLQPFQEIEDIFEQRKDHVQLGAYFEALKTNALAALDKERDQRYIEVLRAYFAKGTFFELLLALIDGKSAEPYAVICHGDCWNNNILFKREHNKVVGVRLIDWQMMRYASPITDLMYFLFTCTSREFRQQYFKQMLDIYYETLASHIERLGSHPRALFPHAVFQQELKSKGAFGLLLAMIVLPIVTMTAEQAPNLEELSAKIETGNTTDLKSAGFLGDGNANSYNKRMREVVLDCIDYGYI